MSQKLKKYQAKRDFSQTPEPKGKSGKKSSKSPIFVVQRHQASRLHYDLRLEVGGVLASWAIPKGPSRNPTVKRLAIHTEDHPLEYADFSGVIPEGNYGAGKITIWDKGTYENLKKPRWSMAECLKRGQIEMTLQGKKLKGGYALIKTNLGKKKQSKNWLLIKTKDQKAKDLDEIKSKKSN